MPLAVMTRVHFAVSASTKAPKSAGLVGVTVAPISANRLTTPGSASAWRNASFSFATTSGGMPRGPTSPHQTVVVLPGRPIEATVGVAGSKGDGALSMTASARSLPDCVCAVTSSGLIETNEIRSPTRSVTACEPPL